jgi:glycosyltransferase involved in cell wall biosynthesis
MADAVSSGSLRIIHVLRAPVGGLFRHVMDLAEGQIMRGHRVGIVADATTGGTRAEHLLAELEPMLALGLTRVPMSRQLGWRDAAAWKHVMRRLTETNADVIHGHGGKGGAYARLTNGRAMRAYTPHGGTLNLPLETLAGRVYLKLERQLQPRTELFLFESAYAERAFRDRIGSPSRLFRIVHNGVSHAEFEPVAPSPEATELLFVGELRHLKGIDVLIEAIALLSGRGRKLQATIVGDGPDAASIAAEARQRGVADRVHFVGPMPAREAFSRGRIVVVCSRMESLPYIVLEAAAAAMPLVATSVGGIPEIFGAQSDRLVPPGDPTALAAAISRAVADPTWSATQAAALRERIRSGFSVEAMVEQVLCAYRDAIAAGLPRVPSH